MYHNPVVSASNITMMAKQMWSVRLILNEAFTSPLGLPISMLKNLLVALASEPLIKVKIANTPPTTA